MDLFRSEINQIKKNRVDGSLQILNTTIDVIVNYLSTDVFSEITLINQLDDLSKTFPDFAILNHFVSGINKAGNTKKELLDFISDYKSKWANVDQDISNHFLNRIKVDDLAILLHSNSRTIHALFEEIARRNLSVNVFQTESLPGGEGILQADYLRKLGFKVFMIKDDDVINQIRKLDMFLIGADRIEPENVINKVGSLTIALLFTEKGKPVYVLADSRKIIEDSRPVKGELFEKAPRSLVTGVITEQGKKT